MVIEEEARLLHLAPIRNWRWEGVVALFTAIASETGRGKFGHGRQAASLRWTTRPQQGNNIVARSRRLARLEM